MLSLILICFVVFLFYLYFKIKFSYWKKRNVQGPTPIPFFGTILQELFTKDAKQLEEKYSKEYGNLFGSFSGVKPILNTSSVEHIKMILRDLNKFSNEGTLFTVNDKYLIHSLFFKNGPAWRNARTIQTKYFTPSKLKNLFGHFDKVIKNFLENIEIIKKEKKSNEIEIKELTTCYSLDIISKVLFAIDVDSYKEKDTYFVKNALRIGELNPIQSMLKLFLPGKIYNFLNLNEFAIEPTNNLGDYFKKLLKQRQENDVKYNDLSELLNEAYKENLITEDEMIGNILLSFFAGVDSVSNNLTQMFYFLSLYPDVQTKLYNEIQKEFNDEINFENLTKNKYLDAFFTESLRLGTSELMLSRTAIQDVQIGDLLVEKGTEIRLIHWIPRISNEKHKNAKLFNPDRFLGENSEKDQAQVLLIPFGLGGRSCLGQLAAQLYMKYLIVQVLKVYEICQAKNSNLNIQSFRGFVSTTSLSLDFKRRSNLD